MADYIESPLDRILRVVLPKKPDEGNGGGVPGEVAFGFGTGGVESDGLSEGRYEVGVFGGNLSISFEQFAWLWGSGTIEFEAHMEITDASSGAVLAQSDSVMMTGSQPSGGPPYNESQRGTLAYDAGSNSVKVEVVVTVSRVTGKVIIMGVWFGRGWSGVQGVVTITPN